MPVSKYLSSSYTHKLAFPLACLGKNGSNEALHPQPPPPLQLPQPPPQPAQLLPYRYPTSSFSASDLRRHRHHLHCHYFPNRNAKPPSVSVTNDRLGYHPHHQHPQHQHHYPQNVVVPRMRGTIPTIVCSKSVISVSGFRHPPRPLQKRTTILIFLVWLLGVCWIVGSIIPVVNAIDLTPIFGPISSDAHLNGTSYGIHSNNQLSLGQASSGVEICYNDKGNTVKHGEQYIPLGIETCTQCTCMHGKAEMCISLLCSPPENCRNYHALKQKCCEFLCLDSGTAPGQRNSNMTTKGETKTFSSISTSNLGLRLIASTITSFLILALLLFMIHRLRQRRLLMMIRRLQTRRLEQINGPNGPVGPNGGTTGPGGGGGGGHHGFRFGYFGSRSNQGSNSGSATSNSVGGNGGGGGPFGFGFLEPPPPYTFWKPPEQFIAPGEAPPPYEEIVGGGGGCDQLGVQNAQLPCYDQPPQSMVSQQSGIVQPGTNPQVQAHLNSTHPGASIVAPIYLPASVASAQNDFCSFYQSPSQLPITSAAVPYQYPGRTNSMSVPVSVVDSSMAPSQATSVVSSLLSLPGSQNHSYEQTYSKSYSSHHGVHIPHHTHLHPHNHAHYGNNSSSGLVRHHSFANATSSKQLQSQPLALQSSMVGSSATYHPAASHRAHSASYYGQTQSQPAHRLITQLASSLNASSQAYVTSPVVSGASSLNAVSNVNNGQQQQSTESIYEHVTVLRIGANPVDPLVSTSHYPHTGRLSGSLGANLPQLGYHHRSQQHNNSYYHHQHNHPQSQYQQGHNYPQGQYHFPNHHNSSYQPRITALGINNGPTTTGEVSNGQQNQTGYRQTAISTVFNPLSTIDDVPKSRVDPKTLIPSGSHNSLPNNGLESTNLRSTENVPGRSHKSGKRLSRSSKDSDVVGRHHRSHHHRHRRRTTLPPVTSSESTSGQTLGGPVNSDPMAWSSSSSTTSSSLSSSSSTSATSTSSSSSSSLSSLVAPGRTSIGPNASSNVDLSGAIQNSCITTVISNSPTSSSTSSSQSQSTVITSRRSLGANGSHRVPTSRTEESQSQPDQTVTNFQQQSPPPVVAAVAHSAKIDIDTISRL